MSNRIGWSAEHTEMLRDLWENTDLSAGDIAKKMSSSLTRNAVIGKANRMKLSRKRKNVKPDGVNKSKALPAMPNNNESSSKMYIEKIMAFEEEKKKLLLACSWPEGDPQSKDFSSCGEAVKKSHPYCKEHMLRAYSKQQKA